MRSRDRHAKNDVHAKLLQPHLQGAALHLAGAAILRGAARIANAGAFKMLPPLFRRFSVIAQPGLYLQTKGN